MQEREGGCKIGFGEGREGVKSSPIPPELSIVNFRKLRADSRWEKDTSKWRQVQQDGNLFPRVYQCVKSLKVYVFPPEYHYLGQA